MKYGNTFWDTFTTHVYLLFENVKYIQCILKYFYVQMSWLLANTEALDVGV